MNEIADALILKKIGKALHLEIEFSNDELVRMANMSEDRRKSALR